IDPRYSPVLGRAGTQRVPGKVDAGTALLTWLDIAPEVKAVQPWVREAAEKTGVDAELLKAVIAVESGYQKGAVSPRGALGLM
ncbi:transglycosylase SLT domain-containing protein, partial [Klebsiella variicola]|uniref:transglycosylase SLT domain-containing protein n=3 Tax=Pseudomonadota TaxID=1224 RepID=UPI0039C2C46D